MKEVTHMQIFDSYLEDKCPLCESSRINEVAETISFGKLLSIDFYCQDCHSDYVVGFMRSSNHIKSEIINNNFK